MTDSGAAVQNTVNYLDRLFDLGILIVGLVLGFFLNKLDNLGRVRIKIIDYFFYFYNFNQDTHGAPKKDAAHFTDSTKMDIALTIELYNKASNTRIINKPRISFYNKNKLLYEYEYTNPLKPHLKNQQRYIYFNLKPKQVIKSNLNMIQIDKPDHRIDNANMLYLSYDNEREKTKKILIKKTKKSLVLDKTCMYASLLQKMIESSD